MEGFSDETNSPIDVGLLTPEDAEGVVRLFRSVHGEDYPIKLFYNPGELIRANQQGDYYSIVARSVEGQIIGIHNLFRSAPSREVYEWGVGLVLKEWRARGVSWAIEQYMVDSVVQKLGMHTVFGEPVTTHLHMQKHAERRGFTPTALEVGLMPGEAYTGEGVISPRVSTLLYFRVYRTIRQTVFIPAAYGEAIEFLYGDFAVGRTFSAASEPLPARAISQAKMDLFDFAKVARIALFQVGVDLDERLSKLEAEAVEKGYIVIQVWIKLTSPWVGTVVNSLRERGYFLGGVLPQWFDDDGFLMQKILFSPDFDSIQLHSQRNFKIRELVKADWKQVGNPKCPAK